MKTETRRVAVFIAAGMVAAATIGFAVWRVGTPAAPYVSDTATPTPVVSTIATTAHDAVSDEAETDQSPPVVPAADDPFLPPNAVLRPEPSPAAPTTVYRPDNIFRAPATGQAEPIPAPRQSPTQQPATPTTTTATLTPESPTQSSTQETSTTPTDTVAPMTTPTGVGGTAPVPTESPTPEPTAEQESTTEQDAEPTTEPPVTDEPVSGSPAEPEPEPVEYEPSLLSVG